MDNLEDMVKELKGDVTYRVYKTTLPSMQHKPVAQSFDTPEEAFQFCKTMKLETKETFDGEGNRTLVFYQVLPEGKKFEDIYHNYSRITTVGNDRKKVARNYLDLED